MVTPAEVHVLCEGQPNGLDVRLLERARWEIEQKGRIEWVRRLAFFPAGGKGELRAALGARRNLHSGKGVLVLAIRDRDFLRANAVQTDRLAAVAQAGEGTNAKPWPLSRHSVESYLLEPSLLAAVGIADEITATVPHLAERQFWRDAARSVLEGLYLRARRIRPRVEHATPSLVDRATAIDAVQRAVTAWLRDSQDQFGQTGATIGAELDLDADDFRRDPLEHRVHGKDLLAALAELAKLGDLKDQLVRHVERHEPPEALVDDLRRFLEQLEATF